MSYEFRKDIMSFVLPVTDESEYAPVGLRGISMFSKSYGGDFDNISVGLFYRKNNLINRDGRNYHECQFVISRETLDIHTDAMVSQDVYREYFELFDVVGTLESINEAQRSIVREEIDKAAASFYHGFVDNLNAKYRTLKAFRELRESAGISAFVKSAIASASKRIYIFENTGLKFDVLNGKGKKCDFGYHVTCQAVHDIDTGYYVKGECRIGFTAEHEEHKTTITMNKESVYPYINVSNMFEDNKDLIKSSLHVE